MNKKAALFILTIVVIATFFFSYHAMNIRVKDDIKSYIPSNDPTKLVYDDIAKKFGLNDIVLVGVTFDDVYKHFSKIQEITKKLQSLSFVDSVISPVNAPRINLTSDGDVSVGSLESTYDLSSTTPEFLQKSLKNDTMIKGKFISNNSKSALFIVGLKENANGAKVENEIKRMFSSLNIHDYHFLGAITANVEIEKIVKANLARLLPLVLLFVMVVLFFAYRTFTGVFIPIIAVVLSDIWTIGIMELLKINFNTTTSAVPIAVIGIGTAYSIHIISRYYEELHKNIDSAEAVRKSVKHVGMAVILSAFTTIAGFMSLLTADLTPVWQLGIFTSIGIAITLFMATVVVPSILLLLEPKAKNILSEEGESLFLKNFTTYIIKHKTLILTLIAIVVVVLILFIPNIRSDMQIENFLNPNTDIVQSSIYLRKNFGGNDYIIVDFKASGKNSFRDFYFNRSLRNISYYARLSNVVSQTTNIGDVVADLTKAFTGVSYIPGSEDAMEQNYMLIEGSQGIDKILSSKYNEAISQMMVNTRSMNEVKKLEENLKSFESKYIFSSYSIKPFNLKDKNIIDSYAFELQQYVFSHGGVYSEKLLNDLLSIKNKSAEQLIFLIPKKELLKMFNSYLQQNYEKPINLTIFEKCIASKADENLDEYYQDFKQDYLPNFRVFVACSDLKKLNLKLSDAQLMELAEYVNDDEVAVEGGPRKLSIRITGIPVLTNEVNDMVFNNQKESMILAYILVFLLFVIQMHSIFMGLLAMIPITLTIIMNFGFMGMLNISLNAATVTIASITIGTGIDYTIHYLSRFKKEYLSISNKRLAAIKTSATSGRAIIINSLAVILGFATFIFSDIGMLKQFGIITAAAMVIAPLLTLTIFPIAMTLLPDKLLRKFARFK